MADHAYLRRLGKAQRAQHRGGLLGTLRFAQPTPLGLKQEPAR